MNYVTLTHERNRRLTAEVRKRMADERLRKVTRELLGKVLNTPVDRGFFVSPDHILVMDRRRREGKLPKLSTNCQQMWSEIFTIFDTFMANNPGSTRTDAAIHVTARGRASRFYVSLNNAQHILKTTLQ